MHAPSHLDGSNAAIVFPKKHLIALHHLGQLALRLRGSINIPRVQAIAISIEAGAANAAELILFSAFLARADALTCANPFSNTVIAAFKVSAEQRADAAT